MTGTTPADTTTTESAPSTPAHNLPDFDYTHLPNHHHILGRPFHALAHHICDVLNPGTERNNALAHLGAARTAALDALPDEPTPAAP